MLIPGKVKEIRFELWYMYDEENGYWDCINFRNLTDAHNCANDNFRVYRIEKVTRAIVARNKRQPEK